MLVMKAPLPPNEAQRLETLRGYDVLDTPPESAFDDLALLAAQICHVPIALISLVDENRQWFKSAIGVSATETSRDVAFCAHTILNPDELFEVRDAQLDPRFADNPLVTADPHIRFYAASPLVAPDGLALGTLCVIDRVPRVLSAEQQTGLRALSHTIIAQLELRSILAAHRRAEEQLQSLNASLEQKVETRTAELRREMEVRRESEQQFRQLSDRLSEAQHIGKLGFIDWDLNTNEIEVSDETLRIYGLDPGKNKLKLEEIVKLVHPDDAEYAQKSLYDAIEKGSKHDIEHRIVRSNGTVGYVHTPAEVLRDANGKPIRVLGTVQDITERKQAKLMLLQHKVAIDTTHDGFWITDGQGILLDTNQAYANMSGYSLDELRGMHISQFEAKEQSLDEIKAHVTKIISQGWDVFETRHRHKDGHEIELEVSASFIPESKQIVTFLRDITERKQAEVNLRIAATAFESHESMMITDADTVILRVNHAFTEITGYTAEEVVGQTPRLLKSGRHDSEFYRVMWETIDRTGTWQGEVWDRRKNGEVYPEWLTISAVKAGNGVVTHYVGSYFDMTEHKAAEESIKNLAFYDPLTSLPNRRLLMDRLQQVVGFQCA
jgi:PAS domain S-box-containing protein